MTKAFEILEKIEEFAPSSLADDFDNVGLLVGRRDKEVKKVLLCLDADENTASEAVKCGADLIMSHHPVIFNAEKSVTDKTPLGRAILTLAKNDITVISAHTNMDSAKGGLNDLMVKKLGLTASMVLSGECGRVCDCDMTLEQLAKRVKEAYNLSYIRFTGNPKRHIAHIALCTGAGRSFTADVIDKGCDVYISGDMHHSDIRNLTMNGIDFIEVGHYESEVCVTEIFNEIIKGAFPKIECVISKEEKVFANIL